MFTFMKQFILSLLVLVVGCGLFMADLTQKTVNRNAPVFNYEAEGGKPGSADMVIGLFSPEFAKSNINSLDWYFEPYSSYKKNMEQDIVEIMTARGYTIRGPFKNRDEMVYSDKEASQLVISVVIDPKFNRVSGGWIGAGAINGVAYSKFKGEIELYGNIYLTASEPLSGEVLWKKNLDIVSERRVVPVASQKAVDASYVSLNENSAFALLVKEDNAVANAVTAVLQGSYEDVLKKVWMHLNPDEFKLMREKIKQLKSKY